MSALPPAIIDRLAQYGVHTLRDWRALGRKRRLIFGITSSMVRQLDALARRVRS